MPSVDVSLAPPEMFVPPTIDSDCVLTMVLPDRSIASEALDELMAIPHVFNVTIALPDEVKALESLEESRASKQSPPLVVILATARAEMVTLGSQ